MIFSLMLRGLRQGKARFTCAVAGIALSVGAVVFMASFRETNRVQAPYRARTACAPFAAWRTDGRGSHRARADLTLSTCPVTIDFRPGGRVLQGPPMRALLAAAPEANPYGGVRQTEGRWVAGDAAEPEVVCVRRTLTRFGRVAPRLGDRVKFLGAASTVTARIVGWLDGALLPAEFPTVFANPAACAALGRERFGTVSLYRTVPEGPADDSLLSAESPRVLRHFTGDEQRRMDYAMPLLLVAAVLTALSLLVNSLLLAVEANRPTLAVLRMVGLTRGGSVRLVLAEALFAGFTGWILGVVLSVGALALYVACDPVAFPAGPAFATGRILLTLALLPPVIALAVLFALRPALRVRPLDALGRRPRRRRRGMAIAFGCGFAAFVAVEVWGASLMRAFIPSPEWPDAIVSILPGGVSSFDIEKLRGLPGVRRISELLPLQVPLAGASGMKSPAVRPAAATGRSAARSSGRGRFGGPTSGRGRFGGPNALFLASEWLPDFRFVEGTRTEAETAVAKGEAVVISAMMARARGLHAGDDLVVYPGRVPARDPVRIPIAGVVDLNWHLVTSRGLVRGLNGAPPMTDGPVFASFDLVESLDPRPAPLVKMTHLWVDCDPEFLARDGVFAAGRRIEADIARRLGDPADSTVRLHARDEIADGTLAHGADVIGQAARVPFVFLAILAIGFVAMLVADTDAARHELAMLRAIGATRLRLACRLAAGAVKTALVGMLAGLPVGSLVGWLFTFGTGAAWPGLPHDFALPVRLVVEGAFGALVFALLFAVPAALALIGRLTCRRPR